MLCRVGKLSTLCFFFGFIISLLPQLGLRLEFDDEYYKDIWFPHIILCGIGNIVVLLFFRGFEYQVTFRSVNLGYIAGLGVTIFFIGPPSWQMFGFYMASLSVFHYSEFIFISITNPSTLSIDSFVINHSVAYTVAASFSWAEYAIERYFFPEMKMASFCSYLGIILSISGDTFRKVAIYTASKNFNHIVQIEKKKDHVLVTHGVYAIFRHPSYVGWFYWAIGTQLILQNPVSTLSYIITSWRFFHDRIYNEEMWLRNFFDQAYIDYQKRVPTGFPFIYGAKVNL